MTDNPFEAAGGGFDMGALLQQAQQMQAQLQATQEKLSEAIVEGTVAGGAVTVRVSGVGELVGVDIKTGGFDGVGGRRSGGPRRHDRRRLPRRQGAGRRAGG